MAEDIKVRFIIPKECDDVNECSEEMQLAFVACEQHSGGGLQAEWVRETQYKQFEGLTKRDVFVFSQFEGDLYNKLLTTKCLLVGPRCLSCCLTEGKPIPSGPEPVYTVAMRGLAVTASGLTKQKKEYIRKKVFWMGGIYSTVLTDDTTHLVSDTVLSDKYIKSVEKGIPIMCESWIDSVWEMSLRLNVNGASSDFHNYRLPPFANLQVTTSGISKKDKQTIMKLVNDNGGTFSGAFQSETTDVVVLSKDNVGSEKYKAALEYGKACVVPAWVKDSVAKGVALPLAQYRVVGASTSSPLAEHSRLPDMSLNFSRITNLRPPSNFVDETRSADVTTLSGKMKLSQDRKRSTDTSVDKDVQMAFENLDMSSIKKAGPIFDGFCIWVTGLEGVCRERAAACVSRAGGVRYDCAHPRVTHVVAGSASSAAAATKVLPNVPALSPMWLLRSVEAGRALEEIEFLIETKPTTPAKSARKARPEPASPMSARNLQLLRPMEPPPPPAPPALPAPPSHNLVTESEEDRLLVDHYLSQPMPEPEPQRQKTPEPVAPKTPARAERTERTERTQLTEMQDEPTEEMEQIFRGIKIEVHGLDEEVICELGAEVASAGGVLVAAGARGVYALLPLDCDASELVTGAAEPVTVFWVKDCLAQQELLPIQYYHRPVALPAWRGEGPLQGVVASLSTYSGVERAFLDELAKLLGAHTQLRFCRRNTANALASTHLICPSPVGDKYMGALKWGLPAVRAEWLLDCARTGTRVSEKDYLVGDTKVPPSPEHKPSSPEREEQTNIVTDKENAMLPPADRDVPKRGSLPGAGAQTPKATAKLNNEGDEMSPASRYIAMARQGLLADSQETPKRVHDLKDNARADGEVRTPPLEDALSTPNLRGLSPTTRRRIQAVRRGEMPSDPIKTPTDPFEKHIATPDSGFGAALRPGAGRLSPDSRKRLWQLVQDLPTRQPPVSGDKQTPLSEIRNRFLAQFNGDTTPAEHPVAARKLHLQEQADTPPPSKIAKTCSDQSAGGLSTDANDSTKSVASASSASRPLPAAVDAQLQRLSAALSGLRSQRHSRARDSLPRPTGGETEPGPESQPNTVGWDDSTPAHAPAPNASATQTSAPPSPRAPRPPPVKRFMLSSNVDNHEEIIEMIQCLGGEVSEGTELDPEATHLLCAAPGRSEKMLGSVAAGRWVLHPAYVARSSQHRRFLQEEEFEWGNPAAACLPAVTGSERQLALAAHRWRSARACGHRGPFAGMVALLHVPPARRRLLARLVAAGGGQAPDCEPPYTDESVTVCFADIKRYPLAARDAQWLAARRVPVCAPVLLSAYLTDEPPPRAADHCLPEFRPTT